MPPGKCRASTAKLVVVSTHLDIPEPLQVRHRQSREGRSWLGRLPGLVGEALQQWQLALDLTVGELPWHGHTGLVLPVLTADGIAAALKVSFPFEEALLEPVALQLWGGRGAVQLLHSDRSLGAMVVERLDNTRSLLELPVEEAIVHWGGLLRDLSIRPDDRPEWLVFPQIAEMAERYCDELPQRWDELAEPFPRWLLEAALEVCQTRGSVARRSDEDVLVHTDLHYLNVLARPGSASYLAIDPQAQIGDAEYAVAPCLWNRLQDLPALGTEGALRRRASLLAEAAGLDAELSVAWSVLREVENALSYLESRGHARDAQRSLWVASTLAGKTLPDLPCAHELDVLH